VIGRKARINVQLVATSFAIAALLGLTVAGTFGAAQALLIPPEEHWKYNVRWTWDFSARESVGIITPQIVIQNETDSRLEGYVADANGTRLAMYDDGMQVVMAKYIDDIGFTSDWEIVDRLHDGYFAIDIPERYRDSETVRIYIGNFQYTIDARPQLTVNINSAITNYATNSTLGATQVAQEPTETTVAYSSDSLIDQILRQNGYL
jgi:hypothetical protein